MSEELKKKLLVIIGLLSLILGIVGIVVPLLPTTPFLLLSATCFFKGSDRLYKWLMNHKYLGEYIRNYQEYKAIPLKTKIISISLLILTISYSIIFIVESIYIRVLLALIAILVITHILHFRTLDKDKN